MGKNWALLDKMILPKRVGGKVAVAFSITLNFFARGIKLGAGCASIHQLEIAFADNNNDP